MTSQCSVSLLESALTGDLPAADEALLQRHLETCEACSTAMEQMAGGMAWCREAISILMQSEPITEVHPREEFSEIDFTVEHLEPSDDPNALGQLGGYDVLEVVGRGGMGVVLKGYDRELKRCVAIKVLAPHLAQSSLAKKRFAREAQAAAAVVHPNVLAIHQVQPTGRLPFLVMPLVAGESLAQRLAAKGSLELTEVLRIAMQAAAGLAAAHEQGLVHRDVKPANILLEKGVERAVLSDFGLARAADDVGLTYGVIAGTPQYMSPEQVKGESLDGRSDLFSLGCVMYEMATGVSPFRSDSTMATLRKLIDEEPKAMASLNPELPPWFVGIVEKLLEKDPSKRFSSAKEVCDWLEGCLAHVQQPGNVPLPPGLPMTVVEPARRRWSIGRWIGTIVATLLVSIGGVGAFMIATADPPDISGEWEGEGWNKVVLKQTDSGEYTGTYTDTFGKEPGKIELKWSRIERQFKGTWSEGKDRFGKISARQIGDEIRGAWTTNRKAKINPGTPELSDLTWLRPKADSTKASSSFGFGYGPVIERIVNDDNGPGDFLIDFDTGRLFSPPKQKPRPSFEDSLKWTRDSGIDAMGEMRSGLGRLVGFDMIAISVDRSQWDLAPELLLNRLAKEKPTVPDAKDFLKREPVELTTDPINPLPTYFIRTREGGKGVLQITGAVDDADKADNPRGVKIRYKLLQNFGKTAEAKNVLGADVTSEVGALARTEAEMKQLQIQLQRAATDLKRMETLYNTKAVTLEEYQTAVDEVNIFSAERDGDLLLAAEIRFNGAKRNLKRAETLINAKAIGVAEFEKAKEQVAVAVDKLQSFDTKELTKNWRRVPFEVGAIYFPGEDRVTIEEVRGTADTMKPGEMYEVKGTYHLVSKESASLAAYVTIDGADASSRLFGTTPNQKLQSTTVQRGVGKFTLVFYMWCKGNPHVSFYSDGKGDIAGVYFGTGDSVLKKGWWEKSNSDAAKSAQPLDLKAYYQTPASKFDKSKYPWRAVPRGEKTLGNIPLDIGGMICLWGDSNAKMGMVFPEQVENIAVNRKFATLYVYHATFFASAEGSPVYTLTLHYADGTSSTSTMNYGTHVRDWYQTQNEPVGKLSDAQSKIVWRGYNPDSTADDPIVLRFCITSVPNPKPSLEVKSISLASAKGSSAGCILAMTTGAADLLKVEDGDVLTDEEAARPMQRVPFELGATLFRNGDRITIDEVRGTADTFKVGNIYEIKGTYRLASEYEAVLHAGITEDNARAAGEPVAVTGTAESRAKSMAVKRGTGSFTLLLNMRREGKPHISFYPENGEGFGHIYFGTGDSVLKKGWWEKDRGEQESKKRAEWQEKLLRLSNHNQTAFAVGPLMIFELSPNDAFEVVRDAWPKITIDEVKTGLLKTFEFARHERVLDVLDLGAQDNSESVRNYAYSYLQNYAMRDFKQPGNDYAAWRKKYAGQPVENVLRGNSQWLVNTLLVGKPVNDERWWSDLDDMLNLTGNKSSYPSKAKYLQEAGLVEVLQKWRDEADVKDVVKRCAGELIDTLKKSVPESAPEQEPAGAPIDTSKKSVPTPAPAVAMPEPAVARATAPWVVMSNPDLGETGVDPDLKEISVTFFCDSDMDKGMSWTGGPPLFPPIDESRKPRWIDGRTCVLPVKLEKGKFYRIGINSSSHFGFCTAGPKSIPAKPAVMCFTTRGASEEIEQRCTPPQVARFEPLSGANDVDPATKFLKVTFDMPMGPDFSWTRGEPGFRPRPQEEKPVWSEDGRTCTLPARLDPGKTYEIGLNSEQHINFQSKWGVPLAPVVYKFRTRSAEK